MRRLTALALAAFALPAGAQTEAPGKRIPASPEAAALAPASSPEAPPARPPRAGGERPIVFRFELHDEMIDSATEFYFVRAFRRAEEAGADAIVIDMDTPGGELGATMQIRNRIFESDIPVYTYIRHWAISAGALIALASDGIYMGPTSSIGGAQPIPASGGELAPAVDEKITSIMRSEVRATIRERARQHPDRFASAELEYQIRLAEAFITPPDTAIYSRHDPAVLVCASGELLTMDWEQAVRERLALARAETLDEVLTLAGLEGAEVREVELTWSENLARFLSRSTVSALLLLVGLGGLYLEFKMPGLSLPGIVGGVALLLFFFGAHLADLSSIFEPMLVLLGFILLGVEIFVIPGFGLTGLLGILCIFFGFVLAMVRLPPPEFEFSLVYVQPALTALAAGLVGFFVLVIVLARYLPRTSVFSRLVLEPATIGHVDVALPAGVRGIDGRALVGQPGRAATDLRPAGMVDIGGQPYDVVTRGEFIAVGTPVRVVEVAGTRIVVAASHGESA